MDFGSPLQIILWYTVIRLDYISPFFPQYYLLLSAICYAAASYYTKAYNIMIFSSRTFYK